VYGSTLPNPDASPSDLIISTTYLDPDAIISAALLKLAIQKKIHLSQFRQTNLARILYSASFWCDYGTGFHKFCDSDNELGSCYELWLREAIDQRIGEDRSKEKNYSHHTRVFEDLVSLVSSHIQNQSYPRELKKYDLEYLKMISRRFSQFVSPELSSPNFGFIVVVNAQARVVPRCYFDHFRQPMIVRVIQESQSDVARRQVLIGTNTIKPNWEKFDLRKLAQEIVDFDCSWELKGRRYVIGTRLSEGKSLAAFSDFLKTVSLEKIVSSPVAWSTY
jgi:hypothetical protein